MAEPDQWTVKANDVIVISLVSKASEGQTQVTRLSTFTPTWTYPIVGDNETIVGYKDLRISLQFNASDMRPHISWTSSARLPETDEIQDLFDPFLPPSAFGSKNDFIQAVQNIPDDWHPPGELIQTYDGDAGSTYEVWKGSLADPMVLALVNRIQILVSLFIEGGTPIATKSTEDRQADPLDRWTIFFLYNKRPRNDKPGKFTYVFAGYSTVYRFFIYRPSPPGTQSICDLELPMQSLSFSDLPCRSRISQFVIIEPFQRKGNGQRLYSTIYHTLLKDANTFEITVEDPNEAFDILRDRADTKFLRTQPEFNDIKINTDVTLPSQGRIPNNIIDKPFLETLRLKYKIAPRQFSRVTEMHLMLKLPDSVRADIESEVQGKGKKAASKADEYVYRLWKLIVKSRINAQNKEQLATLEPSERIHALQETLGSVELEYALLLSVFDQTKNIDSALNKRKLSESAEAEETPTGKKRRLETGAEEAKDGGDDDDNGGEQGGDEDFERDEDDIEPEFEGEDFERDEDDIEPEDEAEFVEELPGSPDVGLLSD